MNVNANDWEFEELVFNRVNMSTLADFVIVESKIKKNGTETQKVKFSISEKIAQHLNIKSKDHISILFSKEKRAYKIKKTHNLRSLAMYKNVGKNGNFSSGWRNLPDGFKESKLSNNVVKRISDDRTIFNDNHVIVFMS